ncbi:MAG: divalent-cation tolerance protein CutA [Planctomycetes bacterium]|nr:divalent-cation tolerance protein CutA [Planctomycetota bacterium]MBI3846004.1 divalent-cation tolerance protein CutA [Planctomycetota bacterium]
MGTLLVVTSLPADRADGLGRALVEERLAACASVLPGVRSTYFWEGKLEISNEALLLLKTRADLGRAIAARLRALHPYDVPEILLVPTDDGNPDYARWVEAETKSQASSSESKPK